MSQNVWATIMPFGPVTLIFYWPKKFFSGTVTSTLTNYTIDAVHMKEMCGINVPLIFLYKVYIFHVQDGHHITLALKKNEEYDEMLICLVDVKWLII